MTATPRKILVADDEESLRIILRETLEAEGYSVKEARDGQEALQIALAERIDLVLTDIRMPGLNGLQLLEELRKKNPKAAVIIMTSHASMESSLEAIRHGAYGYLLKPFPDLLSVINMVGRAADGLRLVEQNEELIRHLKDANGQLSESNELLASRAATISALLDYSQAISALLTEEPFAKETSRAASKLAAGRPCVVYKVGREPLELVPMSAEGIPRESVRTLKGADRAENETAVQSWIGELEQRGEIPRTGLESPMASAYLKPVVVQGRVSQIVAVFEQMGPFPPSVRAVLDKFMFQVRQTAENIALHESMRALAIRDGLTGLYNHRYFQDRFLEEFSRAKRHKHPLSLIFVDVDHFKKFNDAHGHPKGDALLRALSRLIKGSGRLSDIPARGTPVMISPVTGRESDIVARYGGEEFVVILTETDREGAMTRAERLRKSIAESGFVFGDSGESLKVTVSVGVAWLTDEHKRADEVVLDADKAMYAAKRGGRNRVCTAEDAVASDAQKA